VNHATTRIEPLFLEKGERGGGGARQAAKTHGHGHLFLSFFPHFWVAVCFSFLFFSFLFLFLSVLFVRMYVLSIFLPVQTTDRSGAPLNHRPCGGRKKEGGEEGNKVMNIHPGSLFPSILPRAKIFFRDLPLFFTIPLSIQWSLCISKQCQYHQWGHRSSGQKAKTFASRRRRRRLLRRTI
jgi:hypothetical protein